MAFIKVKSFWDLDCLNLPKTEKICSHVGLYSQCKQGWV